MHEKQNERNDSLKSELKFIDPTITNYNHLFDKNPWKNFYDELMIKPKDPPGTLGDVIPNPHYQIIAIILPNGEGDVGRSFMTEFKTFHSNQTFILDMTQRIDSLKKRAREMYSRKWIFVDVDIAPNIKMRQMHYLCTDINCGYVKDR